MTIITRNTLSDWETYKSDNLITDDYKMSYSCLDLPNGPYSSLDDAKTEASSILDIFTSVTASDLYASCESELSPDKNTLIIKNAQKTMLDGHRPLAEAGSSLDTLDVEFNKLQYMSDIKGHAKASWITENNKVTPENGVLILTDQTDKVTDSAFSTPFKKHNDSIDRFFTSINVTNQESNYKNSFVALKKTIEDPSSSSIVHFLNHFNLTFVFQAENTDVCDEYDTYATDIFSVTSQDNTWHAALGEHFQITYKPYNSYSHRWHNRSMFHLVDDYYAITISTNNPSGSLSTELMIDLANNFSEFHWDWENYPGNLYIGNVCKILTS